MGPKLCVKTTSRVLLIMLTWDDDVSDDRIFFYLNLVSKETEYFIRLQLNIALKRRECAVSMGSMEN